MTQLPSSDADRGAQANQQSDDIQRQPEHEPQVLEAKSARTGVMLMNKLKGKLFEDG